MHGNFFFRLFFLSFFVNPRFCLSRAPNPPPDHEKSPVTNSLPKEHTSLVSPFRLFFLCPSWPVPGWLVSPFSFVYVRTNNEPPGDLAETDEGILNARHDKYVCLTIFMRSDHVSFCSQHPDYLVLKRAVAARRYLL